MVSKAIYALISRKCVSVAFMIKKMQLIDGRKPTMLKCNKIVLSPLKIMMKEDIVIF